MNFLNKSPLESFANGGIIPFGYKSVEAEPRRIGRRRDQAPLWSGACCSKIGVSIGPGLIALTRMRRSFNSAVDVRTKERTAALLAL
jgi:hypothetical protein